MSQQQEHVARRIEAFLTHIESLRRGIKHCDIAEACRGRIGEGEGGRGHNLHLRQVRGCSVLVCEDAEGQVGEVEA